MGEGVSVKSYYFCIVVTRVFPRRPADPRRAWYDIREIFSLGIVEKQEDVLGDTPRAMTDIISVRLVQNTRSFAAQPF